MKRTVFALSLMLMTLTVDAQVKKYDVNGDGKVTVTDAMIIVEAILQGNDDATEDDVDNQRKMIFNVKENPLVSSDGAKKAAMRKAPEITTNSLSRFYINMTYYDGDFWCPQDAYLVENRYETELITETGQYENSGSWPSTIGGDEPVNVYGYNIYYKSNVSYFDMDEETGLAFLNVSTEESSADQRDVLVAKSTDTWKNCGGVVSLTFDHICSALKFSVQKTASLADYVIEVNEIKLHNIFKNGKYGLDTGNKGWYDLNTYTNFTLKAYKNGTQNAVTVTDSPQALGNGDSDYLFLIPQEIVGMEKGTAISNADSSNPRTSYLEIQCKIHDGQGNYKVGNGNDYGPVYLPFSATLKQGHIQPYIINIGTAIRKADGSKIFE